MGLCIFYILTQRFFSFSVYSSSIVLWKKLAVDIKDILIQFRHIPPFVLFIVQGAGEGAQLFITTLSGLSQGPQNS